MKDDIRQRAEAILRRAYTQASMTPPRAESLQAIFTTLGIARVARVARALYVDGGGGHYCFRAYGQAGLHAYMLDPTTASRVSGISGLSVQEVGTLIHHFTYESKHFTSELMQWLRAQGADVTTVLALAACEVDAERRRLAAERQGERSSPNATESCGCIVAPRWSELTE